MLHAAAENITPVVSLEMGGKSPLIIFPSADIERAAKAGANSILENSGQSCGCLSRLLVQREHVEEVVGLIRDRLAQIRTGAWNEEADLGPLVSQKQLDRVMNYIQLGLSEGAKLAYGGHRLTGDRYEKGNFIEPTVFTGVNPGMRIVDEEIFGPVLGIISYDTEAEAVKLAQSIRVWAIGSDLDP